MQKAGWRRTSGCSGDFSTFRHCQRPGGLKIGAAAYFCSGLVLHKRDQRLHNICHQGPVISLRLHAHGSNGSYLNNILHGVLSFHCWIYNLNNLVSVGEPRQSLYNYRQKNAIQRLEYEGKIIAESNRKAFYMKIAKNVIIL